MKRLYTYHADCPDISPADSLRLVMLWKTHHENLGFDPFVLQEFHARQHPWFAAFDAQISKLPTVNSKGYDRACYLRWLAVAAQKLAAQKPDLAIMMDYDCLLYDAAFLPTAPPERLTLFEKCVPSIVAGTPDQFLTACRWFFEFQPPADCRHTSDMYILEARVLNDPQAFNVGHIIRSVGDDGWQIAPAVHYCTRYMAAEKLLPKWKFIPQLRK